MAVRTTYGIEAVKDWSRDARRVGWIEDILRDARYALRVLHQKPTFAAMAVVSLAVGIAGVALSMDGKDWKALFDGFTNNMNGMWQALKNQTGLGPDGAAGAAAPVPPGRRRARR